MKSKLLHDLYMPLSAGKADGKGKNYISPDAL